MIWADGKRVQSAAEAALRELADDRQDSWYGPHRAAVLLAALIRPGLFPTPHEALEAIRVVVHKRRSLTVDDFKREVFRLANKASEAPVSKFTFATSLAIDRKCDLSPLVFDGVRVRFPLRLSKSISTRRSAFEASFGVESQLFRPVCGSVDARSPSEALEAAAAAIDTIRAVWALALMPAHRWRISHSGVPFPLSPVALGRLTSVHGEQPSEDLFLCGNVHHRLSLAPAFLKNAVAVQEIASDRLRKLRKASTGGLLRAALRLYVQALDKPVVADAFIGLWTAFERLTGTERDNSDLRIDRASNLFQDRPLQSARLVVLRDLRNRVVHQGYDLPDAEVCAYEMKFYVEHLLRFHFAVSRAVSSESDAICVLDYFDDPVARQVRLAQKVKLIKIASQFRKPRAAIAS